MAPSKAKSDVSDPRTNAVIKRSVDKERKMTNKVVDDAVKELLMESAKDKSLLLVEAMERVNKDNMETIETVSKSIKEEMSEGFEAANNKSMILAEGMDRLKKYIMENMGECFRMISEAIQENSKVLQIKIDRIEEKNREVEAQLNNMNKLLKSNESVKEYIPAVPVKEYIPTSVY